MSGISANALASIPLMRANTGNGANENANGAPFFHWPNKFSARSFTFAGFLINSIIW